MTDSQPTLNSLAAKVTQLAGEFTTFLEANKIPAPTFAADSPTSYTGLTPESFLLRQRLLDVLMDMCYLTQGPSESIFNYAHSCMPDVAALNVLNRFNFWSAVPLTGTATYSTISAHTGLPLPIARRILDHATTLRLFAHADPSSPSTSPIRHTSRSAALAQSAGLRALVSTILDDAGPPMTVLAEALGRYAVGKEDLSSDMGETAFALLQSGALSKGYKNSWEFIEGDGEGKEKGWRQRNFTEFMRFIKDIFQLESVVLGALDWEALGEATVVDLGGSSGHDSLPLAKAHPNLRITIQDLPQVEPTFHATVPKELHSRVSFMAHDFFTPQPVSADVYLIKLILHDWPDAESVRILRGLVPALKPGARVLFIDYVGKQDTVEGNVTTGEQTNGEQSNGEQVNGEQANGEQINGAKTNGEHTNGEHTNGEHTNGEHTNGVTNGVTNGEKTNGVKKPDEDEGLPRSIRAMGTATDLRMMALFNAEERPVEAWKGIFKEADPRFDVVRVEANPLTFMVVMEVVWRG